MSTAIACYLADHNFHKSKQIPRSLRANEGFYQHWAHDVTGRSTSWKCRRKKNKNNNTSKLTDIRLRSGEGLCPLLRMPCVPSPECRLCVPSPEIFFGILCERLHFDALFTEEYWATCQRYVCTCSAWDKEKNCPLWEEHEQWRPQWREIPRPSGNSSTDYYYYYYYYIIIINNISIIVNNNNFYLNKH